MIEFKSATKEIRIEGVEEPIIVESTLFLGRESISLALQLGRMIAPFFKALGGISNKLDLSALNPSSDTEPKEKMSREELLKKMELSPDFFKIIVDQIILTMDEKKVLDLILRLLKGTRVNNQEISKGEIFDVVFQANLGLLMQVLQFILESNFSSFFGIAFKEDQQARLGKLISFEYSAFPQ